MNSDVIEVRSGYGEKWRFKEEYREAVRMFRVWINGEDRGLHESWYDYLRSQGVL